MRRALEIFGPTGRFILSPVDNVRELTPQAHENVMALIDEWQNVSRNSVFDTRTA
jgi:hypothetical protein